MIFETSRNIPLKPTLSVRKCDGSGLEVCMSIRENRRITFAITKQEVKQLRDSLNNWLEKE
jgi:hypothetical protein